MQQNSRKKKPVFYPNDISKLLSFCPLCEGSYTPLRADVLEEQDDAKLLHLQCSRCGSSMVAVMVVSGLGVTSIGLLTDLTSDDVLKFKNTQVINADEVLDFHNILYPHI